VSIVPTDTRTPKHRLVDLAMQTAGGSTLSKFVANARSEGVSWRHIAADVSRITGEDVAPQSLFEWFRAEAS